MGNIHITTRNMTYFRANAVLSILCCKTYGFLWTSQLISVCLAIVCNVAGLVAIQSYQKKTNQNIILAFISISEILMAVFSFIMLFTEDGYPVSLSLKITRCLQWACGYFLSLGMYTLSFDRMICIINPLKYEARLTRERIRGIFVGCISFVITLFIYLFNREKLFIFSARLIFYVAALMNGIYVIFAMITYIVVFYKVRKSTRSVQSSGVSQGEQMKKLFLVPGIIIGTYIVFYVIPLALYLVKILPLEINVFEQCVERLVADIGLIVDPLTYIFLGKHYRNAFMLKIGCHVTETIEQNP